MWSAPVGYGELARGLEPMRRGEIFWISNKRNQCCVDTGTNSSEMDSLWSTSVWTVYYKEWCVSWNQKNSFFIFNVACVASVSVWFRSKEIPRKGTFGMDRARNETRAKKWKRGEGEGKEGNACRQTPRFWKPAFASERSAWLARLVEQCWHVSIKGLFHIERSCLVRDTHINFLWLLFILVGKYFPPMQEHFI